MFFCYLTGSFCPRRSIFINFSMLLIPFSFSLRLFNVLSSLILGSTNSMRSFLIGFHLMLLKHFQFSCVHFLSNRFAEKIFKSRINVSCSQHASLINCHQVYTLSTIVFCLFCSHTDGPQTMLFQLLLLPLSLLLL